MSDESLNFDVVIVGAGPAGLAAAIRLKQLSPTTSVCILEKGVAVGAHSLSGCVFDPCALNELIPDWLTHQAPITVPVTRDAFYLCTKKSAWRFPTPPAMRNHGNYLISLGQLCSWLAEYAQALGVEIYPGFAAIHALWDETGKVIGVRTGDLGRDASGQPTATYQPGVTLYTRHLLLGEGCRGSLSEHIIQRYKLRQANNPQTYGLGLKEIWEVDSPLYAPGTVVHTLGWPLDSSTYGGSFIYHLDQHRVAVGFVTGLDYSNPSFSPFEEFQRFKTHPLALNLLRGGRRLSYGARALNEGGWQSIPQLSFPGGALIGCSAGFLNVAKLKGTHTAMKSGMLAAESTVRVLQGQADDYEENLRQSWIAVELHPVRNIRPGFRYGIVPGLLNAAWETYITRGRSPWTLTHHADHTSLKRQTRPLTYPKPDGVITFDIPSSVYLCNTHHPEQQPCHLVLKDPTLAIQYNYEQYGSPEQYYCPAGVYEILKTEHGPQLQINAANCIHCKTCDIKDPLQNILWQPPEGGSGPRYGDM
jgi:electron-transferring-flavoprotein dehydrogenase